MIVCELKYFKVSSCLNVQVCVQREKEWDTMSVRGETGRENVREKRVCWSVGACMRVRVCVCMVLDKKCHPPTLQLQSFHATANQCIWFFDYPAFLCMSNKTPREQTIFGYFPFKRNFKETILSPRKENKILPFFTTIILCIIRQKTFRYILPQMCFCNQSLHTIVSYKNDILGKLIETGFCIWKSIFVKQ